MKKYLIFFSIILTLMTFVVSCDENNDIPVKDKFTLNPVAGDIEFDPSGAFATMNGEVSESPSFRVYANKPWKAESNQGWLTVTQQDKSFALTASANTSTIASPDATVTVTAGDAKPVVFKVTQKAGIIAIAEIAIELPELDFYIDESPVLIKTSFLPAEHTESGEDNALIWTSSNPAVAGVIAEVIDGKEIYRIKPLSEGTSEITATLGRNPDVNTSVLITVRKERPSIEVDLSQFTTSGNYRYKNVFLAKDGGVRFIGIDPALIESAYNRDFFEYDAGAGKLKFIGDTGNWDIYYSATYNFFWVLRMSDIAPAAQWILGYGYTNMPRWHNDLSANSGFWSTTDVKFMAYMKAIGDNKFQTTVWIEPLVKDDGPVVMEINSTRNWDEPRVRSATVSGDCVGVTVGIPNSRVVGVTMGVFVKGYYRLTYDATANNVHFERLSEVPVEVPK